MRKIIAFFFVSSLLIWSCSGGSDKKENNISNVVITKKEINSEVIKTVANLSIEGMTCAAGCGGKIQQDLQTLKGVTSTELDFLEGRPQNVVSVVYNPSELKETDFIQCVNKIADGQYQVKAIEVISYQGIQSAKTGGGADVSSDNFGRVFQLLNLLQSVARMVQG